MARPKHRLHHLMFVDGKLTKEYRSYSGMRHRSYNVEVSEKFRGGDGFELFLNDVGPCPDPSLDLDRIDNSKGYEPGNLRWSSRKDNLNNRSVTLKVENYNGVIESLQDFCLRTNQNPLRLRQRYRGRKQLHASELA